jgi:acetyl-CoA synthetase
LDLCILDADGRPADKGEVYLVPPSMGLSQELLNRDHHEEYFADVPPGPNGETLRRHGDEVERLAAGFFRAHGRTDDTMNLRGIKVSAAEIERTLSALDGVRETAAVSIAPQGGGPGQLVVYAVPDADSGAGPDELKAAMQAAVRSELNPLVKIHEVVVVGSLPRTASNKVMRRVLRDRHAEAKPS